MFSYVLRTKFGQKINEEGLQSLAKAWGADKVFMAVKMGWISCTKDELLRLIGLTPMDDTKDGEEYMPLCETSCLLMQLAKGNDYILDDNLILNESKLRGVEYAELNNCTLLLNQEGLIQYVGKTFQNRMVEGDGYAETELREIQLMNEYVKEYSKNGHKHSSQWYNGRN